MKIIVAYQKKDLGIGKGGHIPWFNSNDLRLFKLMTVGHPILMGRKTWDSLPKKPLPHRENFVLSKSVTKLDGAFVVDNIEEAPIDSVIIGGAEVYNLAIKKNLVDVIVATEMYTTFDCDTYFPLLNGDWTGEQVKLPVDFDIKVFYNEKFNE